MGDLNLVRTLAETLNDEDLYTACCVLHAMYKTRSNDRVGRLKVELQEGDRVAWQSKSAVGLGKIARVKRSKAIVKEVTTDHNGVKKPGSNWDIPLSMLIKVH
jgi:hypothetical protein